MITDVLELARKFKKQKTLIGLHVTKQKNRAFFAGYVVEVTDNGLSLEDVDPGGLPGDKTGSAWFYPDEIVWIHSDTAYLKGLARLAKAALRHIDIKPSRWRTSPKSIRRTLAEACGQRRHICCIRLSDGDKVDVTVKQITQDHAVFDMIVEGGIADGELVCSLDYIEAVRSGGLHEVTTAYLLR